MSGFFGPSASSGGSGLHTLTPTFALTVIDAQTTLYARTVIPANTLKSGSGLVAINTQCNFSAAATTLVRPRLYLGSDFGTDYNPIPDLTGTALQLATFSISYSITLVWKAGNLFNMAINGNAIRSDGLAQALEYNVDSAGTQSTTVSTNVDMRVFLNGGGSLTALSSSSSWSYYS